MRLMNLPGGKFGAMIFELSWLGMVRLVPSQVRVRIRVLLSMNMVISEPIRYFPDLEAKDAHNRIGEYQKTSKFTDTVHAEASLMVLLLGQSL